MINKLATVPHLMQEEPLTADNWRPWSTPVVRAVTVKMRHTAGTTTAGQLHRAFAKMAERRRVRMVTVQRQNPMPLKDRPGPTGLSMPCVKQKAVCIPVGRQQAT